MNVNELQNWQIILATVVICGTIMLIEKYTRRK